jgi:hypothetical protein
MTPIATVVTQLLAHTAPIFLLDTCSLLDLFRQDSTRHQPRVAPEEIEAAVKLLRHATCTPLEAHLVVPELVPGEFADHADRIQQEFSGWLAFQDRNLQWLTQAAPCVGVAFTSPVAVRPLALDAAFRGLADGLLARATVLAREQVCLDRAVARLIAKRRPSHKKEIKDSMNLEQCLELSKVLESAAFPRACVFVSSNTNDFADSSTGSRVHPDLQPEFTAASLEYFTSLHAAIGSLQHRGQLP